MVIHPAASIRRGDLVAVHLPPGDAWPGIVHSCWEGQAAILPVDDRLPDRAVVDLLERARPTLLVEHAGVTRREDGRPVDPEIAAVVATSGSTGTPKLVELSRDAVASAVRLSIAALGLTAEAPWACPIPVAHIGGLLVLFRGVVSGAPVVVRRGLDPAACGTLAPGSAVAIVPTQLRRLLDAQAPLAHLSVLLVGGQALDPELRRRAEEQGLRVVATYGMTETCGGVVYDGTPFAGVDLRIAANGEIEVRGPTLMRGYRGDAAATAATLRPDGWLRTGDAGAIVDGRLHVHGRLDDAIVTGGEKVWPAAVEAVLRRHPGVAEALVVGRPDPEFGERVVAMIVPADPSSPPTLADLRDAVGNALPRYMAPRDVVLVDNLERTVLGKVRRPRP